MKTTYYWGQSLLEVEALGVSPEGLPVPTTQCVPKKEDLGLPQSLLYSSTRESRLLTGSVQGRVCRGASGSTPRPTRQGRAGKVWQPYLEGARLLEAGQEAKQHGGRKAGDPGVRHPGLGAPELPCVWGKRERRGRDLSHCSPPMGPRLGTGAEPMHLAWAGPGREEARGRIEERLDWGLGR